MKKIEEAAWASGNKHAPGSDNYVSGFEAGARYVLDAMTSEVALSAWGDFAREFISKTCSVPTVTEILAAVRKEIEGE